VFLIWLDVNRIVACLLERRARAGHIAVPDDAEHPAKNGRSIPPRSTA
jgi:hypothetical protein